MSVARLQSDVGARFPAKFPCHKSRQLFFCGVRKEQILSIKPASPDKGNDCSGIGTLSSFLQGRFSLARETNPNMESDKSLARRKFWVGGGLSILKIVFVWPQI